MHTRKHKILGFTALSLFFVIGCNLLAPGATETPDSNPIFTAAAQTLQAQLTELPQVASPSPTPVPATSTSIPPTETPLPTATSRPTNTPLPTPTVKASLCHSAQFIADVTVPDGARFAPGSKFTKVWRLKNIGTCTWTTETDLFFVNGDKMEADTLVALPHTVKPGGIVDVSVKLTAPENPGTYLGNWQLRTESGTQFGIGSQANTSFWVEIKVFDPKYSHAYDLATRFCEAKWSNEDENLFCQSTDVDGVGFVQLLTSPEFENGYQDNEPTLWFHPAGNDRIRGIYPAYEIEDGDHFITAIGCLYGSVDCDVKFSLDYREEGDDEVVNLGSWHEIYDDRINRIGIDLSELAGKSIEFILTVQSRDSYNRNQTFWLSPHIQR